LLRTVFTVEAINDEYPQLDIATISSAVEEAAQLINNNASQIL